MRRKIPSTTALVGFEAAARHMSFTRAGAELGLTQTAVSYQIKLLEDTLGEQLFLRQPRQVSLTDAGLRLAPKVTEAFAILQDAVTGLKEFETLMIERLVKIDGVASIESSIPLRRIKSGISRMP